MNNTDAVALFSIHPDVVYTFIDNEAVLLGADESLFGLNEVGTAILKQLASRPLSIQAISDYLLQQFDVDETQCKTDVRQFIELLSAQKLIKPT